MMINVSNNNFFCCFFIQISISMNKNNVGCEIQWIQLLIYRILNSHRAPHIQTIIIIIIIIIFILFTRMHNQLIIFFSDMNTHTNKEKKIELAHIQHIHLFLGCASRILFYFLFFIFLFFGVIHTGHHQTKSYASPPPPSSSSLLFFIIIIISLPFFRYFSLPVNSDFTLLIILFYFNFYLLPYLVINVCVCVCLIFRKMFRSRAPFVFFFFLRPYIKWLILL